MGGLSLLVVWMRIGL